MGTQAALILHHWEPCGNSGRSMLCLAEKGLDFSSRYVDVLRFEQFAPGFLALNPRGEVPALVHAGATITEASYIEQYLEEVFPATPLMPADAVGRWRVRAWQKHVDEEMAPFISVLDAAALRSRMLADRTPDELRTEVERVPVRQRRNLWAATVLAAPGAVQVEEARRKITAFIDGELEPALHSQEWLAGRYSLADGAAFCFVAFLPRLLGDVVNVQRTPATLQWLRRMRARPAVQATLALARDGDPFVWAAPGPEPVRWG
jgi:glutathione S-transferase